MISPLQLQFYKGMKGTNGAVQFSIQDPHYYVKWSDKFRGHDIKWMRNFEGRFVPTEWLKTVPIVTVDDLTSREGAVFMTISSADGPNHYDWDRKITLALSITDLSKLLAVAEGKVSEVKLVHDPGAKRENAGKTIKYCDFNSPNGIKQGLLIKVAQKEATGERRQHLVPLSGDEALLLAVMVRAIIPRCLAWA